MTAGPPLGPPVGPPAGPSYQLPPPSVGPVCSWHPNRPTNLACSRCGRPACPDCLTPAAVGFHCRACIAQGRAQQRPVRRVVTGAVLNHPPVVTVALIAVNLLVFVVTAVQARSIVDVGPASWEQHGALTPLDVTGGDYWELVTNGFLHTGLEHVALNMISLYFVGVLLERMVGRGRFLAIYLMSLAGGSVAVMLFSAPNGSTVGASGAIFGLMGALLVTFKRFRFDMRYLIGIVALNLFLSFSVSGISWQGHLGGLLVGGLVAAAMVYPPPNLRRAWAIGACVALLCVMTGLLLIRIGHIDGWGCTPVQGGWTCNSSAPFAAGEPVDLPPAPR